MSQPPTDTPAHTLSSVDFDALPKVPHGSPLPAETWLAVRHLGSKKQAFGVSFVTGLCIFDVIVATAAVIIVVAVMAGFKIDMREKILGANAHVVVLREGGPVIDHQQITEDVAKKPGVVGAAPFVYTEQMIRSHFGTSGIILKGIDIERTPSVTGVVDSLTDGYIGELTTRAEKQAVFDSMAGDFPAMNSLGMPQPEDIEPRLPGIIIGDELAELLTVNVGSRVQIINPVGAGTGLMGMPTPTVRQMRVAAIYHSGMYEYDTKWTYVTNEVAQGFLKIGDTVTGIEIKLEDADDADDFAKELGDELGYPHRTRHWKELNAKLFEALELEKWVMGLLMFIMVAISGTTIISTLVMMVLTKGREIAILKAMGATQRSILRLFVIEGAIIGLVGTTGGVVIGLAGAKFLETYQFPLETDVYMLSSLPVVIVPSDVAIIAVAAFTTCFLCTLYPARRAAALDPVEGLRYE